MKVYDFKVLQVSNYGSTNDPKWNDLGELIAAADEGKEIWFKCNAGSKSGSIGKIINPDKIFQDHKYTRSIGNHWGRKGTFLIDYGNGKETKVAIQNHNNHFTFMIDYDGGYVNTFTKGTPKAKVVETSQPDLLGNKIKVGDWVIFQAKRRSHGEAAGLGKLTRLSAAGNAWVISPGKYKDQEIQTESASSLIKVHMTDELLATYTLCDSIWALKTKLTIDLDLDTRDDD